MKFKLINPSDPYTIEGPDLMIVAVAACLLGDGKYALKGIDEDEEIKMPIFTLSKSGALSKADDWFAEKFSMTYEGAAEYCIHKRGEELAKVLESVKLTSGRRSSMNNIGRRAELMAGAVREAAKVEA